MVLFCPGTVGIVGITVMLARARAGRGVIVMGRAWYSTAPTELQQSAPHLMPHCAVRVAWDCPVHMLGVPRARMPRFSCAAEGES